MPTCPRCGGELKNIHDMDRWYCENCRDYIQPEGIERPPPRPEKSYGWKILVLIVAIGLVVSSVYFFFSHGENKGDDKEVTIYEVSDIRDLEVLDEVDYDYMSRDELADRLSNSSSDGSGDNITEMVLNTLFLLEPGTTNVSEDVQKNYTEQVMGFYDSEEKKIYVIESGSSVMKKVTLSHELTHALQDQHFDLQKYKSVPTSDEYMTRQSVYEGDASLVQRKYIKTLSSSELEKLRDELDEDVDGGGGSDMPYYLERMMKFPYYTGLEFVDSIYDQDGWRGVDQLYSHPPSSTEQIMHPEKYNNEEGPMDVSINQTVANMSVRTEDVMGEFMVNTMMGHYLSNSTADRAAGGWGGDRYRYYNNETDHLSIFKIRWDDQGEADEFANIYSQWLNNLPEEYMDQVEKRRFRMVRNGTTTTIYHSSDVGIVDETV